MAATNIGKWSAQATLDAQGFSSGVGKMVASSKQAEAQVGRSFGEMQRRTGTAMQTMHKETTATMKSIQGSVQAISFNAIIETVRRFIGFYANALARVRAMGERAGATDEQRAAAAAAAEQQTMWSALGDRLGAVVSGVGERWIIGIRNIANAAGVGLDAARARQAALAQRLAAMPGPNTQTGPIAGSATEQERIVLGQPFGIVQTEHRAQARSAMELLAQLNREYVVFGQTSEEALERQLRQWPKITNAMRETIREAHRLAESQRLAAGARTPLEQFRQNMAQLERANLTDTQRARLAAREVAQFRREDRETRSIGTLDAGSTEVAQILANQNTPREALQNMAEILRAEAARQAQEDAEARRILEQIREALQEQNQGLNQLPQL